MKYLKFAASFLLFAFSGLFLTGLVFSMVSDRFNFPANEVKFVFGLTLLPFIVLPAFYGMRLIKEALKKDRVGTEAWVDMEDTITVECSISLADYVLFNLGLVFSRGIFVVVTIIAVLGVVNFFTFRQAATLPTLLPLLVVLILVPATLYYNYYKTYHNTPHIKYSTKYILSNEGIHAVNELGNGNAVWRSIIKVKSTKKFLLLFNTPVTCYILKKDAFVGADLQRLENFLKANFNVE